MSALMQGDPRRWHVLKQSSKTPGAVAASRARLLDDVGSAATGLLGVEFWD